MRDPHPFMVPAAVAAAFGLILAALFVVEQVRPVGKPADAAARTTPQAATATSKPPVLRKDTNDQEAAVEAWEAFATRVKSACEKYNNDPVNRPGGGKPSNFVRFEGEDLRKSDSLRYPFEGEIIVYEVFHFGKVYVEDVRWFFGWKGGKWEYKNSTSQRIKTPGGPTDPEQLDEQPRPVIDKLLESEKKKLILDCL